MKWERVEIDLLLVALVAWMQIVAETVWGLVAFALVERASARFVVAMVLVGAQGLAKTTVALVV